MILEEFVCYRNRHDLHGSVGLLLICVLLTATWFIRLLNITWFLYNLLIVG